MRKIFLLLLPIFCLGCSQDKSSQSCDLRIVKNHNGTFSIQVYSKYPGWHYLGIITYKNLDEAKRVKNLINKPMYEVIPEEAP
jgi:hypothetical protein